MSFTGYPHAAKAMAELRRVLKPAEYLVMVDINYPRNGNRLGSALVALWRHACDLIRDMDALFREFGFAVTDEEIGGFGSVHLYVATKRSLLQVCVTLPSGIPAPGPDGSDENGAKIYR